MSGAELPSPSDDWITLSEAERLVANYVDRDSDLSEEALFQILKWILQDKLSTMAVEVTRWVDAPPAVAPAPAPPPPQPAAADQAADDGGLPLPAYRVRGGAYRPSPVELSPPSVSADYPLCLDDWIAIMRSYDGPPSVLETMWAENEITHPLAGQRRPGARVTYSGLKLSRPDIERRIAVAGWTISAVAATPTSRKGRPPSSGSYAAHDEPLLDEMARLIASGEALSPNAAAVAVAPRARGASDEAKVRRLRDAFKARENKGAK